MRQRPAWERVRAETLMHHGKGRFDPGICEIGKIELHLLRRKHSFVNQGIRGKAAEVEFGRRFFDSLPDEIEFSFEPGSRLDIGISLDEHLLEDRFNRFRRIADGRVIGRHQAPSEESLSRASDGRFDDFLAPALRVRIARKADHSDAVSSRRRKMEAQFLAFSLQELMRNLHQDSGTVSRVRFATFRSAMLQVQENLK